jgi:oxaloacetate decarboxylase gamma subunit
MNDELMAQGVELMLYGMGTVVVFLALLVLVTTFMSQLVNRYFPEPEPVVPAATARPSPAGAGTVDGRVIAVITAAIQQHRAQQKK